MSVFLYRNHLFLRSPQGGVESVSLMVDAGFGAVFCNIGDFDPSEWDLVRERSVAAGAICGPWLRTANPANQDEFSPEKLAYLIEVAHSWETPYIVNSESELLASGSELTTYIQRECGADDYALSMQPIPFANVDWTPIKAPIMPQCFGPEYADGEGLADLWRTHGVSCIVPTYGTYNQWPPDLYQLLSPYGLYTADDCGGYYEPWRSRGNRVACKDSPAPPNGGDMPEIGYQDGITAAMNRLRDLDPGGTVMKKKDGKWPDLGTLPADINTWKAYDKLERTLQILKDDHDA